MAAEASQPAGMAGTETAKATDFCSAGPAVTDGPAGLDELDPGMLALLKARKVVGGLDTLTDAERAALPGPHGQDEFRPRQLRAKLRGQLRLQVARLRKQTGRPKVPAPPYLGPPVNIGFDAEWVTWPDGRDGWRNEVLCITAVVECGGRYAQYMFVPRGPTRDDRPTMAEFFQKAIDHTIKVGVVPSMPDRVTVFGHFLRGDLATFIDFWARKREFRGLGKTLISGGRGHLITVEA